jgi:hypothetical protein
MIAGLPITGIGGVFYLLLALWMPVVELWRLGQGKSSVEAWKTIARQLIIQAGVLVTIAAQVSLVYWLSPSTAQKAAETGNQWLGMEQASEVSHSLTAGLVAGTTIIALGTLCAVQVCVYMLRAYFTLTRGKPAQLA